MKKLLLVSALFLFLLFVAPLVSKEVLADCCTGRGCGVPPRSDLVDCGFSIRCATQAECNQEVERVQELQQQQTKENEEPTDPTCNDGQGINTAIGCIPITNTNLFIGFILRWAIGIGGGIAFLLIVSAAFTIMTSQGNPERLKAGQELLTSAIAGLIMLIFSVFILRVIGVDILKLPGF